MQAYIKLCIYLHILYILNNLKMLHYVALHLQHG